jgi:hypothetical protein
MKQPANGDFRKTGNVQNKTRTQNYTQKKGLADISLQSKPEPTKNLAT